MKQQQMILVALLVLVIGFFAYQHFKPVPEPVVAMKAPDGSHLITLTDNGYVPATLTIQLGETVTFANTTDNLFWPASNLHPSHLIYSEFDPRRPLKAEETWSFTFTKAGAWEFHDHLAPYYTGVITVTE